MPRLMRTVARTAVVAGTATAVSNRVSRRQANRWTDQAEAQAYEEMQQAPPPPAAAPAEPQADMVAQLKELAELKARSLSTKTASWSDQVTPKRRPARSSPTWSKSSRRPGGEWRTWPGPRSI
jgi:hypothetical protein